MVSQNKTNGYKTFSELIADPQFLKAWRTAGSSLLLDGPILGGITKSPVSIGMRTLHPARVEVEVTDRNKKRIASSAQSTAQTNHIERIHLDGLQPVSQSVSQSVFSNLAQYSRLQHQLNNVL